MYLYTELYVCAFSFVSSNLFVADESKHTLSVQKGRIKTLTATIRNGCICFPEEQPPVLMRGMFLWRNLLIKDIFSEHAVLLVNYFVSASTRWLRAAHSRTFQAGTFCGSLMQLSSCSRPSILERCRPPHMLGEQRFVAMIDIITFMLIDRLSGCMAAASTDKDHPAVRYGRQLAHLRQRLSGIDVGLDCDWADIDDCPIPCANSHLFPTLRAW